MTRFQGAVYTTSFSLFINNQKWAEISPGDQAAIMAVSGPVVGSRIGAGWDQQNERAMAALAERGIPVIDADPAFAQKLVEAAAAITEK